MKEEKVVIGAYVTKEFAQKLKEFAKAQDQSVSAVVRVALTTYLDSHNGGE